MYFYQFPFFIACNIFLFESNITKSYQEWGYFLNGLLGPKISYLRHTARLVSSIKDHYLQFQILYRLLVPGTTLSHQFQSDTHDLPS